MTNAPRPLAHSRRLLAHGLGLGLLAGGVVLGAQGAAHALQYVFADGSGNTANGLQLSFDRDQFGTDPEGTARVTGSFDLTGGNLNIIDDIQFQVLASTAGTTTVSETFSTGYYNASTNTLFFGVTSGGCPQGFTNCLELQLVGDAIENGDATAQFETGDNNLGDYYNTANSDVPFGLVDRRDRDLTLRTGAGLGGQLLQIPAPLSALALLPLAGLKRYRSRVKRLSQASSGAGS